MTAASGSLHILPRSPVSGSALRDCMLACRSGDSLLLIEDGVYAGTSAGELFAALPERVQVLALDADCVARSVAALLDERIERIDYDAFVALVERHVRSITWT